MKVTAKIYLILGLILIASLGISVNQFFKGKLEGSNRANCVLQQRGMWSATKIYVRDKGLKKGDPLDSADILASAGFKKLECDSGGTYQWSNTVPDFSAGVPPVTCSHPEHAPKSRASW